MGIKVSFEDEGADFMDVIFLKAFCDKNKIPITLKIAGAEAVRDIKDASKLQVRKLVAPMIESVFALEKFIKSADKYYTIDGGKICINKKGLLDAHLHHGDDLYTGYYLVRKQENN